MAEWGGAEQPLDESERGRVKKSGLRTQHSKNEDHGTQFHSLMANRREKVKAVIDFIFLGSKNHCGWWLQPWNQKMLVCLGKSYGKPRKESEGKVSHAWLFVAPWTVAYQAPLSMWFPRQEYRSGLLFPSPIYIYFFSFWCRIQLKSVMPYMWFPYFCSLL